MKNKRKIIFFVCLVVFLFSIAFLIGKYYSQNNRGDIYEEMQKRNEKLEKELETSLKLENDEQVTKKVVVPIDFKSLQKENKDIYAWIKIPGTEVDYPILQHPKDDSFYLEHTVEKKKGLPGTIYTESLNNKDFSDRNTVIYGHNMKDGSMFGDLALYMDESYMKEKSKIVIYTPEHIYTYKIFAAVTYNNRHILHNFDFSKNKGLAMFLNSIYSVRNMNSYIDEDIKVDFSDRIITLSTCTAYKEQRFLVEAVLIDEQ